MPLPILNYREEDLIRLFHKTEHRSAEHLAEPEGLEVGTAFANPALSQVWDANNIRDVALPEGMTAEAAIEEVEGHYREKGTKCAYWVANPSAPADRTGPIVEALLGRGYRAYENDILLLQRAAGAAADDSGSGLKIIPARASFRHVRMLAEESAGRWEAPQLVEAMMLHLDDPHWDALLALKDGEAVAYAGVLGVGEVGRVDDVYVAKAHRGKGVGRVMMGRILEICARSLFKQVMLSVWPGNEGAKKLYEGVGFGRIGAVRGYFAPGLKMEPTG